ncbi:MAG: CoA-binding protein [Candidatus Eiseniibacteriota bacterium]
MSAEPLAPPDRELMELLEARPVVAVVGASSRLDRPSHIVMMGLMEQGYTVIPVNPNEVSVLGQTSYPDLRAVPRRVDLVDVFRRPEFAPDLARAAAEVGARILWLQMGVVSDAAAAIARAAGLTVVMDRCLKVEHERLIGMPFPRWGPTAEYTPAPIGQPDPVGLCRDCRFARQVPAAKTTYWLCRRSAEDPTFPRYPRLPIRACRGFAWNG